MTHWRKYVSASNPDLHHWDIEDHSPITVTITSHEMKEVHCEDSTKKAMCFLSFKGAKKPLGINATNGHIIEAMHGSDIEGWIGKKITLRIAELTSGPKRGEVCIRVDAPKGLKLPGNCHRFKYLDTAGGKVPNMPKPPPVPPESEEEHEPDPAEAQPGETVDDEPPDVDF